MAGKYLPRIVDDVLDFKLKSKGAVWIKGPKWCGKSTTAKRFAKTSIMMQDEDTREQNTQLAKISPSTFLKGDTPLLIDEWQTIPFIWNQIRTEVDRRGEFGQFILTGSVVPDDKALSEQHSGTGRITDLVMRPMTLFESKESDGSISLSDLFNNKSINSSKCDKDIIDYAFYTARGGWPLAIGKKREIALQQAIDYYDGITESDLSDSDGVKRDPERVKLLLRSYARNCSTQANNSTIRKDMLSNENCTLDVDTVASYVKALKRLYVVEESESWNPNLRSKTAIRTSNTRYFVDPSIACAALGIGPEGLIGDLRTFGLLFENLCLRDLRVYSDRISGTVKHFRNSSGRESDAVITLRDGRWGAVEVKLGSSELIDEGAESLLALNDDIDSENKASFLMVLTTTNAAYRREDDVWVVPLGCLGP